MGRTSTLECVRLEACIRIYVFHRASLSFVLVVQEAGSCLTDGIQGQKKEEVFRVMIMASRGPTCLCSYTQYWRLWGIQEIQAVDLGQVWVGWRGVTWWVIYRHAHRNNDSEPAGLFWALNKHSVWSQEVFNHGTCYCWFYSRVFWLHPYWMKSKGDWTYPTGCAGVLPF